MKIVVVVLSTLALIAFSFHFIRAREAASIFQQGAYIFGTRVEISIYGRNNSQADRTASLVFDRLGQLHKQFHSWEPSELTALNTAIAAHRPFHASDSMAHLLIMAQQLCSSSGGLFDPGIGKLVKAWGFQQSQFDHFSPEYREIADDFAHRPSIRDLDIEPDNTVVSRNPFVAIDFGGYAKGWALDRAAEILKREGVENALINIGGNIMALGSKGGAPWRVAIQHPRQAGAIAVLTLQNGEAIGTSGDYYRYYQSQGVRYSHIIDPRTGAPAQASQAVTVLTGPSADAGALSDGASKPLFILGPKQSPDIARAMHVRRYLIVDQQGGVWISPSMVGRLSFTYPHMPYHVLPEVSKPGDPAAASSCDDHWC